MPDRSRYRQIQYVGARILEARELNQAQAMVRLEDANRDPSGFALEGMYREGATLNVSATVSGSTVTLAPADITGDMLVMVRGVWEKIKPGELGALSLSGGNSDVLLNWSVNRITLADDDELLDTTTGEATGEMGELVLAIATSDTSEVDASVALASNQLDKNRHKVVLFHFLSSGGGWAEDPLDNALPRALGNTGSAGLVKLTATPAGLAVGDDDSRLSDDRGVTDAAVWDSKVRTPVSPGGTNSDETAIYDNPATAGKDKGGISAVKVILVQSKQLLEDGFNWLRGQFVALQTRYLAHETASLGLSNTHPIPTPLQVGATPDEHMGLELGIDAPVASHPPVAHMDQGGFRLYRAGGAAESASDYSYATLRGATLESGFTTDADVYARKASTVSVAPPVATGQTGGSLGVMSLIAQLLKQHVELQGTGSATSVNPHGLAPTDIGAPTIAYVDSGDASVLFQAHQYTDTVGAATLASANAYTDSRTGFSVRKVVTVPALVVNVHSLTTGVIPGGANAESAVVTKFFEWMIVAIGPSLEIGLGLGILPHGSTVPLPSEAGWSSTNCVGGAAMASYIDKNDLNGPTWQSAVASMGQTPDAGGLHPSSLTALNDSAWGNRPQYGSMTALAWRYR